jgi:hypothetical protein
MTREGRMDDGPNVIEQTQAPATLHRPTEPIQLAILRDTIAARRDRDTSGLHPIYDMGIAIAQTSGHAANLGQSAARLDFQTISVVTLCHWEPPLHL